MQDDVPLVSVLQFPEPFPQMGGSVGDILHDVRGEPYLLRFQFLYLASISGVPSIVHSQSPSSTLGRIWICQSVKL